MPYANPGGAVTWPLNADFDQAAVDWAINRAYSRLVSDLGDLELLTQSLVFPSMVGQYSYPLQSPEGTPISGFPALATGVYATGSIVFSGTVTAGQTVTVTIAGVPYTYMVPSSSTSIPQIIAALTAQINSGSQVLPNSTVLCPVNQALNGQLSLNLRAGVPTFASNLTTIAGASSGSLALTVSGPTLSGGTPYNPPIRTVRRVFYHSLGQLFRLELEPGARLISWQEFNRKTATGYLLPFSFATWPAYCSVDPKRQNLYLYGAPTQTGDMITVEYCPIIAQFVGLPATQWGFLVNPTDFPMIPEDTQDAIWMGAAAFLNPAAREYGNGELYSKKYRDEVQRAKDNYTRDSAGDALILRPVGDALATSGYGPWTELG
jgi:hypothetical protein